MQYQTQASKASEYTLDEKDVHALINATKTLRDKLIIELLAFTGCRRSELVLLRFKDINLELGMISMPTTKQEKKKEGEEPKTNEDRERIAYQHIRRIPIINDDLKRDLHAYMEVIRVKRHITPSSRLIQSRQSKSITEVSINNIVADTAKTAGINSPNPDRKQVHPHQFRHTFVRYARKNGVDYKVIQKMVGHASIATTMDMYGEPSWEDKIDELSKMKSFGAS